VLCSYQPSIAIEILARELGFLGNKDAEAFIRENGGVIEAGHLLCKQSLAGLSNSKILQSRA